MSRYNLFREAWNEDFRHNHKTFPENSLYDIFKFDDDINYQIPLKFRYRPDLIALQFYNNSKLFWVLVYANDFYNSPEDFEVGTKIRVPRYEKIMDMV